MKKGETMEKDNVVQIFEEVCEHCKAALFQPPGLGAVMEGRTSPPGKCKLKPPTPVILPLQQRSVLGGMETIPMIQSVYPPIERNGTCCQFERKRKL